MNRISNQSSAQSTPPLQQRNSAEAAPRPMYFESKLSELSQSANQWEHMIFGELAQRATQRPLNYQASLSTSWDTDSNVSNFVPRELMTPSNQNHMPSFYPQDIYCPSLPSSPDSEPSVVLAPTSFPELADMRSEAGILNSIRTANDPSKEERKLERRRERNRASQRAFRKRKEKYVQELEGHYLELRRRYEGLLMVMGKMRREAGGDGGWCGPQDSDKTLAVVTSTEFDV